MPRSRAFHHLSFIITDSMNRGKNLCKAFERLFADVVVAQSNVQIHVANGTLIALRAQFDRTEFDFAAVKT